MGLKSSRVQLLRVQGSSASRSRFNCFAFKVQLLRVQGSNACGVQGFKCLKGLKCLKSLKSLKSLGFRIYDLELGIWNLVFGAWYLELGIWNFEAWYLVIGTCDLDFYKGSKLTLSFSS